MIVIDNKTDRTVLPIAKDRQEPSGNGSEKGDELNLSKIAYYLSRVVSAKHG